MPRRRPPPAEPRRASPPAGRKADAVARDLLGRIVRGEHEVGSTLPTEPELAAAYGVNRSVVREAVKLLEVHRLVRPVRRRGTVVLSPAASTSPEVLRAMLEPRPGELSPEVLASLLEVRAILDVEMTALATRRRTKADLQRMDGCLRRLRESVGDPARYGDAALDLSLALAAASKNHVLEMLAEWNRRVVADLDRVFSVTRPATSGHVDGFALVVDLIRKKDEAGARQLVRAFHDWSTPRVLAAAALTTDGAWSPGSKKP